MHLLRLSSLLLLLFFVSACVTINVYFPVAEAQEAADEIIDKVWGNEDAPPTDTQSSYTPTASSKLASVPIGLRVIDVIFPAAQAANVNIDISSPAIRALHESMAVRHEGLVEYYNNGAIGVQNDALITLRDPKQVPLRQRNTIKKLVEEENQDRLALYREIAIASRNPQWEQKIRDVFAERWVERAQAGWWYQNQDDEWVQK